MIHETSLVIKIGIVLLNLNMPLMSGRLHLKTATVRMEGVIRIEATNRLGNQMTEGKMMTLEGREIHLTDVRVNRGVIRQIGLRGLEDRISLTVLETSVKITGEMIAMTVMKRGSGDYRGPRTQRPGESDGRRDNRDRDNRWRQEPETGVQRKFEQLRLDDKNENRRGSASKDLNDPKRRDSNHSDYDEDRDQKKRRGASDGDKKPRQSDQVRIVFGDCLRLLFVMMKLYNLSIL